MDNFVFGFYCIILPYCKRKYVISRLEICGNRKNIPVYIFREEPNFERK